MEERERLMGRFYSRSSFIGKHRQFPDCKVSTTVDPAACLLVATLAVNVLSIVRELATCA